MPRREAPSTAQRTAQSTGTRRNPSDRDTAGSGARRRVRQRAWKAGKPAAAGGTVGGERGGAGRKWTRLLALAAAAIVGAALLAMLLAVSGRWPVCGPMSSVNRGSWGDRVVDVGAGGAGREIGQWRERKYKNIFYLQKPRRQGRRQMHVHLRRTAGMLVVQQTSLSFR